MRLRRVRVFIACLVFGAMVPIMFAVAENSAHVLNEWIPLRHGGWTAVVMWLLVVPLVVPVAILLTWLATTLLKK